MRLRVGVLGAGSWGTTVATLASRNAPTVLWARRPELVDEINTRHTNERYLPGFALPEDLPASNSIAEVVGEADVVVMGVPSHGFRSVLKEVAECIRPWVPATYRALGTDGFGRSDWRKDLRRFFEVDRYHVVVATLSALAQDGRIAPERVSEAIARYEIDPDAPDPAVI